jgi:hypothetical protein
MLSIEQEIMANVRRLSQLTEGRTVIDLVLDHDS